MFRFEYQIEMMNLGENQCRYFVALVTIALGGKFFSDRSFSALLTLSPLLAYWAALTEASWIPVWSKFQYNQLKKKEQTIF